MCCISDADNKIVMSDMSKPTAVVTQDLIIYQLMIHIKLMPLGDYLHMVKSGYATTLKTGKLIVLITYAVPNRACAALMCVSISWKETTNRKMRSCWLCMVGHSI